MVLRENSRLLVALSAGAVTTATFAKHFVPFYLIGSTAIFVTTCLCGMVLIAVNWREVRDNATYVNDILIVAGLLYGVVIASYLVNSFPQVPVTHLLGILFFHGLFLVFGFAAARALKVVFAVLLAQGVLYSIIIAQYTIRFGDMMRGGNLQDVFDVGIPSMVSTFHQEIGDGLGLATLAALGLSSGRARALTLAVLPFVLLFMFHIAARTALVALVCALAFLTFAELSVRSRKLALFAVSSLMLSAVIASAVFYKYAVQDNGVDAVAPDALSRTIREIHDPNPLLRLQIWLRAWHHIATEPDRLAFGRGIGVYPIDEGFGAPDWLLRKTEGAKHYPHNVHLEMLYETGIVGMVIFSVLVLFPLVVSFKLWKRFSMQEQVSISLYVFYLVSIEISGSFAFSYDFQFFFAVAVGVVSLGRKELSVVRAPSLGYVGSEVSV